MKMIDSSKVYIDELQNKQDEIIKEYDKVSDYNQKLSEKVMTL